MLNINNYPPELVAEVEINIGASTANPYQIPYYKIHYLAEPPVTIPQLKRGIAFMYGGTQFGDYQDLGDGRSCLVADNRLDGVVIAKGSLTTPFTKFGDGSYRLTDAQQCCLIQDDLKERSISTEETLAIYRAGAENATAIIKRACPYRIGTFEYVSRHYHKGIVKKLFKHLIINYVDPDADPRHTSDGTWLSWFRAIVMNYGLLYEQWHKVGFVHGCLNTDNMSAVDQTIDVQHSFFSFNDDAHSEIDVTGRYSRENQENAVLFGLNKYRLSLQSLFPNYTAEDMYKDFRDV